MTIDSTSEAGFALRYHGDVAARGAEIDFAVNVRGATPTWLKQSIIEATENLTAYPDATRDREVREALGRLHGRPAEEVLLLGGVAEGFSLLPNLGLTPTIIYPQFTEPEAAFAAVGAPVRRLVLTEPFSLADAVVQRHEMIIVGNPTNPTGVLHSREQILSLTESAELVVVDEAFMDVAVDCDAATVAGERNPKLLVFRSMTKTWSIAGLRCGYVLGAPEVLEKLARSRPHWPVGTLQLEAMRAIADHAESELPSIRASLVAARKAMATTLIDAGWRVFPSEGPFLLVQPPLLAQPPCVTSKVSMISTTDDGENASDRNASDSAERIRLALAERGIAVRRCDTFPGLDATYWRLAVRGAAEVGTLVDSVRELISSE